MKFLARHDKSCCLSEQILFQNRIEELEIERNDCAEEIVRLRERLGRIVDWSKPYRIDMNGKEAHASISPVTAARIYKAALSPAPEQE